MSPRRAGALAVGVSLVVVLAWFATRRAPRAEAIADATIALSIRRHDAFGVPSAPVVVRDRGRVRAILDTLALDAQPTVACPADYATAEVGLVLTGRDVYARRNAYVWSLATEPRVIVADSTGCRGGPLTSTSATALRGALASVDAGMY